MLIFMIKSNLKVQEVIIMFKKIIKFLENIFVAASFAEAGEFDTAREILGKRNADRQRKIIRNTEQRKRIQMRA